MYSHWLQRIQPFILMLLIISLHACSNAADESQPPDTKPITAKRTLESLELSPNNAGFAVNTQIELRAIGIYSDFTKSDITDEVTWKSSEPTKAKLLSKGIGTKSTSIVVGNAIGIYKISASLGSVASQSTNIIISNAALKSIIVESSRSSTVEGTTINLKAIGHFTDGSKQKLTDYVTWKSADAAVARFIENTPSIMLALQAGSTAVTASLGSVQSTPLNLSVFSSSLESLQIESINTTIGLGTHTQFTATGIYADSSKQVITNDVMWTSSNEKVASLSNDQVDNGTATASAAGVSTISANFQGIKSNNTVKLVVTEAELSDISISTLSGRSNITLGSSIHFRATGNYSDRTKQDLTDEVIWISSNQSVTTVDNSHSDSGLAKPIKTGQSVITALYNGVRSTPLDLTVTDAKLVSIAVTPSNQQLALDVTQQYTATGTYSNDLTADISKTVHWESTNSNFATISNTFATAGLATTIDLGTTLILAHLSNLTSNSATLTATNTTLTRLNISPNDSSIILGSTQQFTATGIYSDKSSRDITDLVTWQSDAPQIVIISNAVGRAGLASSLGSGTAIISGSLQGLSATTSLSVNSATFLSINLSPASAALKIGQTQLFKASGIYSNGTVDITNFASASWTSTNTNVATVVDGLVTANASGSTDISVNYNGKSNTATLNVTLLAPTLLLKSVNGPTSVDVGKTLHIGASNGTSPYLWSINNSNASISTKGWLTGKFAGPVTVTATDKNGYTGTLDITITAPPITLVSIDITPVNPQITSGGTQQFEATGLYSDSSKAIITNNISWSSSSPILSFSTTPKGFASSNFGSTGTIIVTGTLNGIPGQTQVSISGPTITVTTPAGDIQAQGSSVKISASGGNPGYTWSVNDTTLANIDLNGNLTPLKSGDVIVTATDLDNFTGTLLIGIIGPPIAGLFPDPALQACVNSYANLNPQNALTTADQITNLRAYCDGNNIVVNDIPTKIVSLSGIENLTNLISLELQNNSISNLTPLTSLTKLVSLSLVSNNISDYSPIASLTNLTFLNLSFTGFTATTNLSGLQGLSSLETLFLVNDKSVTQSTGLTSANLSVLSGLGNLTELGLNSNNISNLSFLSNLTNLEYLYLGENRNLNQLVSTDVQGLKKLIYISLDMTNVTDISPLGSLLNLQFLHIPKANGQITLPPLNQQSFDAAFNTVGNFPRLAYLHLGSSGITDFTALENLNNLSGLDIDYSNISDITSIANLTTLTFLDLSGNPITNFNPLNNLTLLTELDLQYTGIANLTSLGSLTKMQFLHLANNQVVDVSPLSSLSQLKLLGLSSNFSAILKTPTIDQNSFSNTLMQPGVFNFLAKLYIDNTALSDISALSNLPKLEILYAVNNGINVIPPLNNLSVVDFSYNQITDVTPLTAITITNLNLAGNTSLSNIDSLASLKNLWKLQLQNTAITDLSQLENTTGPLSLLQYLDVNDNPITNFLALKNMKLLNTVGLYGTGISDLRPLSGLINMTYLVLGNNLITDVSPLQSMTLMQQLFLSNNRIGVGTSGNVDTLQSMTQATIVSLDDGNGNKNLGMSCAKLDILINALNTNGTTVVLPNTAIPGTNCTGPLP